MLEIEKIGKIAFWSTKNFSKNQRKMSNLPSPAKIVKYKLQNAEKQAILDGIMQQNEFTQLKTHREQCYYLYSEANRNSSPKKPRITKEDIAAVYGEELHTIKYHISRYKDEKDGKISKNGRPFILTDEEVKITGDWINSHNHPPKLMKLVNYIQTKFAKSINYKGIHILLDKLNLASVEAQPIEEERYTASEDDISKFFSDIEKFCNENDVPSFMAFNLDEEGNDEFVDASVIKIVIPKEEAAAHKTFHYPVKRRANHTTFLGCVTAHGSFVKPLVVIKRATIESTLISLNYGPDRLLLGHSDKGYVNRELFERWLLEAFEPYVVTLRSTYGYSGPGLIIADGCTAHKTEVFNSVCERLNLRIFFLPPHSSNQLQVLDLGLFGIHKTLVKKLSIDEVQEESQVVQIIVQIMNAWYSACTPSNIQGAWRAMGARYIQNSDDRPRVCLKFSQQWAIKLLGKELSKEQRQEHLAQMLEPCRRRISIDSFNSAFKDSYPRLYDHLQEGQPSASQQDAFVESRSGCQAFESLFQPVQMGESMDINHLNDEFFFADSQNMNRISTCGAPRFRQPKLKDYFGLSQDTTAASPLCRSKPSMVFGQGLKFKKDSKKLEDSPYLKNELLLSIY